MVMHPWEEDCIQIAQGFQDRSDSDAGRRLGQTYNGVFRCLVRLVLHLQKVRGRVMPRQARARVRHAWRVRQVC